MNKSSNNVKNPNAPSIIRGTGFAVLQRVKFELGYKSYYSDKEYELMIYENHLEPYEDYNKDTDQRNMLECVYSILQTLCNDIDQTVLYLAGLSFPKTYISYLAESIKAEQERAESILEDDDITMDDIIFLDKKKVIVKESEKNVGKRTSISE